MAYILKMLYHSAHVSSSLHLDLGKGFSSWLWERQFLLLKHKKASFLKKIYTVEGFSYDGSMGQKSW